MGFERGRVTSYPEEHERVPGQVAAAWFTNNRNRRICLVRQQNGRYTYVVDLDPKSINPACCTLNPSPEPNIAEAVRFVLLFLQEQ